jgi:hypothetical protein
LGSPQRRGTPRGRAIAARSRTFGEFDLTAAVDC